MEGSIITTENARWIRIAAGVAAVVGMLWALWLTFWPPQHQGKGYMRNGAGAMETPLSCGMPALFQESALADSFYNKQLQHETSKEFAAACADKADARIRGAAGVIVVTLPITVLWVRSDLTLRTEHVATT